VRRGPVNLRDPVDRGHPLNRGRAHWWLGLPGLDGGRTLYDLVGGYHGTLTGFTASEGWRPSSRPGAPGPDLLFDYGTAVDCGTPPAVYDCAALSFGAWMFRAGSLYAMVGTGPGGAGGNGSRNEIFWLSDSACYFVQANQFPSASPGAGWHRFLWVYDGAAGTIKGYVDGRLTGSSTGAAASLDPAAAQGNFRIGLADPNYDYTTGRIADVAVWSRTLSAADAAWDYELGRAGYPGVLRRRRPAPAGAPTPGAGGAASLLIMTGP
jgi:hypothetical protein